MSLHLRSVHQPCWRIRNAGSKVGPCEPNVEWSLKAFFRCPHPGHLNWQRSEKSVINGVRNDLLVPRWQITQITSYACRDGLLGVACGVVLMRCEGDLESSEFWQREKTPPQAWTETWEALAAPHGLKARGVPLIGCVGLKEPSAATDDRRCTRLGATLHKSLRTAAIGS